jgi:hypothetical protein
MRDDATQRSRYSYCTFLPGPLHPQPLHFRPLLFNLCIDSEKDYHGLSMLFIQRAAKSVADNAYHTQTTRCPARNARVMRLIVGQTMYDVPLVYPLLKYVSTMFASLPCIQFHPPSSRRESFTAACRGAPCRYDQTLTTMDATPSKPHKSDVYERAFGVLRGWSCDTVSQLCIRSGDARIALALG